MGTSRAGEHKGKMREDALRHNARRIQGRGEVIEMGREGKLPSILLLGVSLG